MDSKIILKMDSKIILKDYTSFVSIKCNPQPGFLCPQRRIDLGKLC